MTAEEIEETAVPVRKSTWLREVISWGILPLLIAITVGGFILDYFL